MDYLFVDEAGQVSLANTLAISTSTKNIILIGDQMQLSQPIQGIHSGNSGKSALDFYLEITILSHYREEFSRSYEKIK